MRIKSLLLSSSIMCAFLGGTLVHSIVPHAHGEGEGAQAVWQSLHAALVHDEKMLLASAALIFSAFFGTFIHRVGTIVDTPKAPLGRNHSYLSRGIHKYRRFR